MQSPSAVVSWDSARALRRNSVNDTSECIGQQLSEQAPWQLGATCGRGYKTCERVKEPIVYCKYLKSKCKND
jgi:hypothetical protein